MMDCKTNSRAACALLLIGALAVASCASMRSVAIDVRDLVREGKARDKAAEAAAAEEAALPVSVPDAPAETPAEADKPAGVVGDNSFLWKPVSESRGGRAAVLLPANIAASSITVNGEGPADSVGRTNGGRQTYFLKRTGSAYGANVKVVAVGTGRAWTVPNGGARWGSR